MRYNVTLKEGVSRDELDKARAKAVGHGGKIIHEFTLIQGFSVEFPADHISIFETDDNVDVEADVEVHIQ